MTHAELVSKLVEILGEVTEGAVPPNVDTTGPQSIRALKLTSVKLLAFMVEVEDVLGIEWDDDMAPDTTASFEALAGYIYRQQQEAGAR
ncbi:hypothetical protein [Nocardia asteroides]|uniref:Carrier domain-containing protein n=1 Tax=Nocardia asteroides NBRC 15531 TaxID=1110697 RepID=U5ELW3_NOCAS|nr:hypothetical protein [Nocardia asteroides]TLF63570.1 hypothetical protein FEK33_26575 [Nocardia asteroides NBRC 15531]UGT46981.1 hypothetical protein LT345_20935 [Nocardia asteroides]SFM83061.1 hypothetical protein SAMN05444423_104389 [Nocardia asteroides]VEG34153.1 Uncharacterised protein [Nocardia asteroides]GAD87313.1 hypothetical protein NCAST_34_04430 [Nocardia asteroides NBRC 15531]